mgnify:CR=1 FL=1
MNIKMRMIGDKVDSNTLLIDANKLQLGTKVYTKKFPFTKDVGVLTVIEGLREERNSFQIAVKSSQGELLGKGGVFRAKIKNRASDEAIVVYNINKAYFENRNDFYIIELWSNDQMLDSFELGADADIYKIYEILDEKGSISLLE